MRKKSTPGPGRGGKRPGAGRPLGSKNKPKPPLQIVASNNIFQMRSHGHTSFAMRAQEVIAASKARAAQKNRGPERNPFQIAQHPPKATPPKNLRMALDQGIEWAGTAWTQGIFASMAEEGTMFLGYPYLAELAQRPEFRVISETIATEMTRKWIKFKSTGSKEDKAERIKELTDEFERLEVRDRFKEIAVQDGFFGRSHLFLDFDDAMDGSADGELKTDIGDGRNSASKTKVSPEKPLKALKTVEAVWTYPTTYNAVNPLQYDWYNPQVWYVMGKEVHCSRLPTFIGHPVPDLLKPAYSFGGLSLSQMAQPYVDIWLQTRQSVGDLIHSFSVMVLKTDIQQILQPGGPNDLSARVNMFNALRDNAGTFVVNRETEDFANVSAPLSGLHELQAQSQEHMASVARIPLVKFTGISPTGLNASSDGEMRAFYDTINAYQESFFRPHLTKIAHFVMLSLWGEVDEEIRFGFEPLWEMSEKERSEIRKTDAETAQIHIDTGVLSSLEERKRIANDPDTLYDGLDVEDLPDLRSEEIEGLVPEGSGRGLEAILEEGEEHEHE